MVEGVSACDVRVGGIVGAWTWQRRKRVEVQERVEWNDEWAFRRAGHDGGAVGRQAGLLEKLARL